mmetsp:Transcript_178130/g.570988  ORF Transcript_178130/g.570988 Transcript_178130/m.570988 type:complete len:213 (-) Transcript_178130:558-1196(-)
MGSSPVVGFAAAATDRKSLEGRRATSVLPCGSRAAVALSMPRCAQARPRSSEFAPQHVQEAILSRLATCKSKWHSQASCKSRSKAALPPWPPSTNKPPNSKIRAVPSSPSPESGSSAERYRPVMFAQGGCSSSVHVEPASELTHTSLQRAAAGPMPPATTTTSGRLLTAHTAGAARFDQGASALMQNHLAPPSSEAQTSFKQPPVARAPPTT